MKKLDIKLPYRKNHVVFHEEEIIAGKSFFSGICDCGNKTRHSRGTIVNKKRQNLSCGCQNLNKNRGETSKTWKGYNGLGHCYFTKVKKAAEKRNLVFDLKIEEMHDLFLQQNKKCKLTNLELELFKSRRTQRKLPVASLDRIDSKRGYIIENVQWLHSTVQYMKHAFDQNYFVELMKEILNYKINQKVLNNIDFKYIERKRHTNWSGYKEISGKKWTEIKRNSYSRKTFFNITIEDAWKQFEYQKGICSYTGRILSFPEKTASLDRINSNLGYTIDNIQWIYKDLQYIKNDLEEHTFLEFAKLIAENN